MKYPAFKAYFFIWSISVAASLLLHARSFWLQHEESDEIVYVALARRMSWTISDYSTRDIPGIRLLPYSIYRQPLFHQPPLYPLILKLGSRIGNPAICGLVFSCGSMVLLLWTTWRWMVFVQMPPSWAAAGFAGLVFCPLLLASTSLLHLDGLLGIYAACGMVFYIEALEHCSVSKAALAGLLLAAALNLRYNSLLILPLIPALQAFQLYRLTRGATGECGGGGADRECTFWSVIQEKRAWTVFAIVVLSLAILGFPHYYRIMLTYGTLNPGSFIKLEPGAEHFSSYMGLILRRQPWRMALYLVCVYPILLVWLSPAPYRLIVQGLRRGSWAVVPLAIFLYMLPVEFVFSYQQMRFFAAETPFLYLGVPCLLRSASYQARRVYFVLGSASLFFMITTGFLRTVASPPDAVEIMPSLFYYLPPLLRYYE